MSKRPSIFYSARLERFFQSPEDAKAYPVDALPADLPFDALPDQVDTGRPLALEFSAKTGDYFRLWVVCQCLTMATFGLYGPWARTRKANFLASHWRLDKQPFEVHFIPAALLRGRLLVFAFLLSFALLSLWNPWTQPFMLLAAFAAAPWLLANSFAFRWRTLRFKNIQFDSEVKPSVLRFPFYLLGLATALATVPLPAVFSAKSPFLNLAWVIFVVLLPAAIFWPRATAALTHYRFSQASWGNQQFNLNATPKIIYSHMWRNAFSRWTVIFSFAYGGLVVLAQLWGNRDAQAVVQAIGYLLLTVFAVTLSRSRRLNFVLHRLNVGGLRFESTMNPDRMSALTVGYALLAVCTLGLSIPWSTVHFCKWRAARVALYLDGDWTQFQAVEQPRAAAGALNELGNAFDIEIGI